MRQCKCGKELLPHKRKWCSDACQRKYHENPRLRRKNMNKCQHTFVHISNHTESPKLEPHQVKDTTAIIPVDVTKYKAYAIVVCPYCGHTRHVHTDGLIEVIRDAGRVTFKHNDE